MTIPTDEIVTLTLTEEERTFVSSLAQERGLKTPADVFHALLKDATNVYDALWDKKFAESQNLLDKLADDAHDEYAAGLTEDFDFGDDSDV